MKIMAIDYGTVRTGVAISDAMGFIAGKAYTINAGSERQLLEEIISAVKENKVERIVVGLPKNMNDTEGERAIKSKRFAELVKEQSGLDVIMWDERLTTVDAHRILSEANKHGKKRRDTVDAVAATLILQSYLDSIR